VGTKLRLRCSEIMAGCCLKRHAFQNKLAGQRRLAGDFLESGGIAKLQTGMM
jgi:hypothetical protein